MKLATHEIFLGLTRIGLGWIFFWPFLDKLFGLHFPTSPQQSWLHGVSPTQSYLAHATKGPFMDFFHALAGSAFIEYLFMIGLLLVGTSLILGIGVRIASVAGTVMLLLIFLAASLPPEHNPVLDEHIIYALILLGFLSLPVGEWLGLGTWWKSLPLVQKYPIFR